MNHVPDKVRTPASLQLIDTPPEAAFDRVTRLAAQFLDAPVSHLAVLDATRSFLKSEVGLPPELRAARQLPLSHSFCRHVVASGQALVVQDTRGHPLVGDNPVIESYGVRSYLGLPVRDGDDRLVCVLCVLDFRTRDWSARDLAVMEDLVAILRTELALRAEIEVRRAAEDRARLLMREMEHRVKNGLSTVQAIISMSLRGEGIPEAVRQSLMERIASLSQTHALLLESAAGVTTLAALLDRELRHYAEAGRVTLAGPDLTVADGEAVTVGMMIHELATNAAKYGALGGGGDGRLDVAWSASQGAGGGRRIRLEWRETVSAAPRPPEAAAGFGTRLLDTLIVRQQKGTIERTWRPDGLTIVAEFNVSEA